MFFYIKFLFFMPVLVFLCPCKYCWNIIIVSELVKSGKAYKLRHIEVNFSFLGLFFFFFLKISL